MKDGECSTKYGCKYPNAKRTPRQRRLLYCYLRHLGLNRNLTRAIVGRSDPKIALSLQNLPWSVMKVSNHHALYPHSTVEV